MNTPENLPSPQLLLDICNALPQALLVIQIDGTILSANRPANEMFVTEKACGKNAIDLLGTEGNEISRAMQIVMRTGRKTQTNIILRQDGVAELFLEAVLTPLPEAGGELRILLTLEDQTDRQEAISNATRREKMAGIGLLAAGVAHEFNNIWSAVHGYAELSKQDERFLPELADIAIEQADRASEIIRSLLTFSEKRAELRHGIHIGPIINSLRQVIEMELRANAIEVNLDIRNDPPVYGNEGQLQEVFLNVAMNAVHAIGSNGKIDIVVEKDCDFATITFTDNGSGMTPREMENIFVPFYTTKGALGGNELADGHGLGLTLSYNIIRNHGGTIEIKSRAGEGSIVTIKLPVSKEDDKPASRRSTRRVHLRNDTLETPRKFLIADDDPALRNLLKAALRKHEVATAATAQEAISHLDSGEFDALLLDLVLGGKSSGLDILMHMKEKGLNIPAIMISGYRDDPRLQEAAGMSREIIYKPFSIAKVLKTLNRIVH